MKKADDFFVIGPLKVTSESADRTNLYMFLCFFLLDTGKHGRWQTMKTQTIPPKGGISSGSALFVSIQSILKGHKRIVFIGILDGNPLKYKLTIQYNFTNLLICKG